MNVASVVLNFLDTLCILIMFYNILVNHEKRSLGFTKSILTDISPLVRDKTQKVSIETKLAAFFSSVKKVTTILILFLNLIYL